MAVNIQFSSPSGVLRSVSFPGMTSAIVSRSSPCVLSGVLWTNHLKAMGIGVVKHDVKISCGSSALRGSHSPCAVGHNTIVSRMALRYSAPGGTSLSSELSPMVPELYCLIPTPVFGVASLFCNVCVKNGINTPAPLQSNTTMEGLPIHLLKSVTLNGM